MASKQVDAFYRMMSELHSPTTSSMADLDMGADSDFDKEPEIEREFDDGGSDGERSGGEESAGESCNDDISLRLCFFITSHVA